MGPTRLRLSKPVIAAIEGPAVAGGLELALWCDLRVAAADAVLGVYCRRFGVPLVDLGTMRLPRLIGHSRAIDLILTGRGVDGVEAERIGLVNRVVAPGTALIAAVALASELAALPQLLPAQRPAVGHRAVGPRRDGGDAQRGRARPRHDRQWRDAGRRGPVRRRRRPPRWLTAVFGDAAPSSADASSAHVAGAGRPPCSHVDGRRLGALVNPFTRTAVLTFLWAHRHEVIRWGRSLWEHLAHRDLDPATTVRDGEGAVRRGRRRSFRNAKQLRRVTMDAGVVDLQATQRWPLLPALVDRVPGRRRACATSPSTARRSSSTVIPAQEAAAPRRGRCPALAPPT